MKRRHFLNHMARLAGAASLASLPMGRIANAAAEDKVLVIVFLRGGWDGLSVVVPYGEDDYYNLRPGLAVNAPGASLGALDLDGFFGMHPSMGALYNRYADGQVAIMPTVLHDGGSMSHFTAQDMIESASIPAAQSGWLARLLAERGIAPSEHAISLSHTPPLSLAGASVPAPNFVHLSDLNLAVEPADRNMLNQVVNTAYAWEADAGNPNAQVLHRVGQMLSDQIASLQSIAQSSLTSQALYPDTLFGLQMRHAAALIKARSTLNVLTVDMPGWDTHSDQGSQSPDGIMSRLLENFSSSVAGFFDDLGTRAADVLMLAATEFGRTAAENGSKGTDHGHASTWLAVGPSVRGGIYTGAGAWPGLASDNLADGRALNHTLDFRSIYAEIAYQFMGVSSTAQVLPGFTGTYTGFL